MFAHFIQKVRVQLFVGDTVFFLFPGFRQVVKPVPVTGIPIGFADCGNGFSCDQGFVIGKRQPSFLFGKQRQQFFAVNKILLPRARLAGKQVLGDIAAVAGKIIAAPAQKQDNGVGAGGDKSFAAKFRNCFYFKFFQQQLARSGVYAGVGENGGRQNNPRKPADGKRFCRPLQKQHLYFACLLGQMRQQRILFSRHPQIILERLDRIGRIGDDQIKLACRPQPFVVLQAVAKDNVGFAVAVDETGDLCGAGKTVILLHAVDVIRRPFGRFLVPLNCRINRPVLRAFAVFPSAKLFQMLLQFINAFGQKMAGAAGVVENFR